MADLLLRDCDPDEFKAEIVKAVAAEILKFMADQNAPPGFADRPEMAEIARIGTATLDNLVSENRIPSVMVGRRRLFEPQKVLAALAKNANGPSNGA